MTVIFKGDMIGPAIRALEINSFYFKKPRRTVTKAILNLLINGLNVYKFQIGMIGKISRICLIIILAPLPK